MATARNDIINTVSGSPGRGPSPGGCDPHEGVAPDGTITTGARRDRVPLAFEPVLREVISSVSPTGASLYLYGSVATGTARVGVSDVDLLSLDLSEAAVLGERLSGLFSDLCRGVEIAAAASADFLGDGDQAYGNRVFLRHYCVHLAGPERADAAERYPADARAARGFNGDLDRHLERWRHHHESTDVTASALGRRIGRKTLLAVAGMVSVHDRTWTTDRSVAADRWSQIQPELGPGLAELYDWATGIHHASHAEIASVLDDSGLIPAIVDRFAALIGLWR
ncbi:nucleotidyltransferase domain-containing protein [Nocardioides limicola]|uniref:nucleotidyltransferase domain-containing protein n=1 Tax=Nocardioides limicola TaxID=2803368 RepID=UPI001EF0337D|nr:nucleotidyltransferase domain-containing protein [Nocardioides sp. DJM-14]